VRVVWCRQRGTHEGMLSLTVADEQADQYRQLQTGWAGWHWTISSITSCRCLKPLQAGNRGCDLCECASVPLFPGRAAPRSPSCQVICISFRQEQHGNSNTDVCTAKSLSQLAAFRLVVVCHQICHLAAPTTSAGAHCPSGVILLLWWFMTPAACC